MSDAYLGHDLCNLFVPEEPASFELRTPASLWVLSRDLKYAESKEHVFNRGGCAITYALSTEIKVTGGRAAAIDAALGELLPICLGASYITCMTVRPVRDLPMSAVQFLSVGHHFPRERAMGSGWPMADNLSDFIADLENFVRGYIAVEHSEKARLLIHHWLDAMAFWSLEDLTLSTTTILEIIAATADRTATAGGGNLSTFAKRIDHAADRFGLPHLPPNFRNMRNDLVHEGHLSGSRFPNKSNADCAEAVSEALDWTDCYLCEIFGLGRPRKRRFLKNTFFGVNSFSLD
jgi:hypothetical protein